MTARPVLHNGVQAGILGFFFFLFFNKECKHGGGTMKVLDFNICEFYNNILQRGKKCTIRLGDHSLAYAMNEVVWVTRGDRFTSRERIYPAIIDKICVKPITSLTLSDRTGDHPAFEKKAILHSFLEEAYNETIFDTDVVTVIYFSEIILE